MLLKKILRYILLLGSLYLLLLFIVYTFQKRIIFQPKALDPSHVFEFEAPFEELNLHSSDGQQINALYFKRNNRANGLVLYFHGNADNLQRWGKYHTDFTDRNYDVFMIDYRSYGKSTGEIEEEAMYEDAQLAYDWAIQKYAPEEIIIYGRSLGSAIASNLASKVAAQQLILETPFNNMNDLFKIKVPVLWLPFPLDYHFPNGLHLEKVKCPVMLFQGTKDRLVPNRSTQRLQRCLKASDQLYSVKGATHYNLSEFEDFQKQLDLILGSKK